MSLILDALRKSDDERKEQRAPAIARAAGKPAPAPSQRWVWPMTALLLVNAAILIWLLVGRQEPPAADNTTLIEPASQPVEAASSTAAPGPRAEVKSLLAETIDSARAERQSAPAPAPPQNKPPATRSSQPSVADNPAPLPTYRQLSATPGWSLAPLTLELHVYRPEPAARFAFINGQRVTERDRLNEGPRVLEITAQGIILEFEARRFLLLP